MVVIDGQGSSGASSLQRGGDRMYLTVREVLALPPLGELRLVSGQSGLDRQVMQVSVLEVVGGPRQWWRGGELFMSTLHMLHDADADAHVQVLRNLNDHDAAALILHPGLLGCRYLTEMRAAANDLEFPLILMPQDMPYAVVTDAVMGGLLGRQAALLERSAAINRELIEVALRGGTLDDICRAVARRTRQPVAVVSADGIDVLGDSGHAGEPGPLLHELLERRTSCGRELPATAFPSSSTPSLRGLKRIQTTMVTTDAGAFKQVSVPVTIRNVVCAHLVTWEVRDALTELDFTVLAHACTAVGLEVLKQQAVLEAERRVQQSFYGAALSGALGSQAEASRRAAESGVDLAPAYLLAALPAGSRLPAGALRQLGRWQGSAVVRHRDSTVLILPIVADRQRPIEDATRILEQLGNSIIPVDGGVAVGLSRIAPGVLTLPAALAEARLARSVAERLKQVRRPLCYDQLGIYHLLAAMPDEDLLRDFAMHSLEKLLAARGGATLIETLEAYLDAGGSPRAAGRALHLHPNTIKYRMESIRQIVDEQALTDPARRLGLHVALKIRHLDHVDGHP